MKCALHKMRAYSIVDWNSATIRANRRRGSFKILRSDRESSIVIYEVIMRNVEGDWD